MKRYHAIAVCILFGVVLTLGVEEVCHAEEHKWQCDNGQTVWIDGDYVAVHLQDGSIYSGIENAKLDDEVNVFYEVYGGVIAKGQTDVADMVVFSEDTKRGTAAVEVSDGNHSIAYFKCSR